jgi:integrase
LRRSGPNADLRLDLGVLLIRRSHTIGDSVMEATKTGLDQRLHLPAPLLEVLAWHVAEQLHNPAMYESELLFPSISGGFRSRSCLDKPFAAVSKEIGLPYHFTPRGLRRSYQDLARGAGVADVVTRSISGHQTESMQRRYSTVAPDEMRGALAAVIDFASGRRVG